jgi:hypothetical protein
VRESDPDHRTDHGHGEQQRMMRDERQIHARADRDKEQAEQQAAKRFDIGFDFPPELAIGEHDTREKRAERGRQTDRLHQQCNGDDEQQCRGRENLALSRVGDKPEHGAQ